MILSDSQHFGYAINVLCSKHISYTTSIIDFSAPLPLVDITINFHYRISEIKSLTYQFESSGHLILTRIQEEVEEEVEVAGVVGDVVMGVELES